VSRRFLIDGMGGIGTLQSYNVRNVQLWEDQFSGEKRITFFLKQYLYEIEGEFYGYNWEGYEFILHLNNREILELRFDGEIVERYNIQGYPRYSYSSPSIEHLRFGNENQRYIATYVNIPTARRIIITIYYTFDNNLVAGEEWILQY